MSSDFIKTISQFAEMVGVQPSYVSMYIKRGKIHSVDKKIDITNPTNVAFINNFRSKNENKQPKKTESKTVKKALSKKALSKTEPIIKTDYQSTNTNPPTDNYDIVSLDNQKKQEEINKKKLEVEKLKLTNARLRGEMIPTELVKNLITNFSASIIKSYREGSDRLLMEISHMKRLTLEEDALMKGELIKIINDSHDVAISETMKSLESILKSGPENLEYDEDEDED
jgi:predicted transcriptional regulator